MTRNQIEYANYLETKRANLAKEQYNLANLEETIRSNRAKEDYNQAYLNETARSNVANENIRHEANTINANHYGNLDAINMFAAKEQARHNASSEMITSSYNDANIQVLNRKAQEEARHNIANESFNLIANANQRRLTQVQEENLDRQRAYDEAMKSHMESQDYNETRRTTSQITTNATQQRLNQANTVKSYVGSATDIIRSGVAVGQYWSDAAAQRQRMAVDIVKVLTPFLK